MSFWIRHVFLLVVCVVLPAGAALYSDAQLEKDQASTSGATAAQLASQALRQRLTLEAHRSVGVALGVAQNLRDQDALGNLKRNRAEAFEAAKQVLATVAPANGFAWLVDAQGNVLVGNDMAAAPENARSIIGHPIYIQTQLGYAVDGFWSVEGSVVMVAAAPIADEGRAIGAVIVGRNVDANLATAIARDIESQVTLVSEGEMVVSTLDEATATEIVAATEAKLKPVLAGRLAEQLGGASLPMLPLFVDRFAQDMAYSSTNVSVPGVRQKLKWIVTVKASQGFEGLAGRQEIILGVTSVALLFALLIGLLNYRTFVVPIESVSAHLSEIQLGRGDLELPEARVSKPFRRLVRLVNMTVQKMPARSLSSIGTDLSSVQDLGSRGQSGLHLSRPDEVPEPLAPPMPPPAITSPPPPVAEYEAPAILEPALPPPAAPQPPAALEPAITLEPIAAPEPESWTAAPALEAYPPAPEPDDDDAIAAAIAALEGNTAPLPRTPPVAPSAQPRSASVRSASVRSASSIRGGSPFDIEEGSQFGRSSSSVGARPPDPAPGVRGGGSLDLSGHAGIDDGFSPPVGDGEFNPEATVVAAVQHDLLAHSARDDLTDAVPAFTGNEQADHTMVAQVPPELLAQSAREGTSEVQSLSSRGPSRLVRDESLDDTDRAHFKEVYERFVEMRRRCGENTGDLAFDRFLTKLTRNRDNLIKKYSCRTVRFQVYEKDGKAALKATPVRAR